MATLLPAGKFCRGCKTRKPLHDFYVQLAGAYGRSSRCKDCLRASARQRYRNHDPIIRKMKKLGRGRDRNIYHKPVESNAAEAAGSYCGLSMMKVHAGKPYQEMSALCEAFERKVRLLNLQGEYEDVKEYNAIPDVDVHQLVAGGRRRTSRYTNNDLDKCNTTYRRNSIPS